MSAVLNVYMGNLFKKYESTTTRGTAVVQLFEALHHNTKVSEFNSQNGPWKFLSDLFFCPFTVVLGSTQTQEV
jgi:hypothetical protein